MTIYTLQYIDNTSVTLRQPSLTLLFQTPDPVPPGDFTTYVHLTSAGLRQVQHVTVTLDPGETTANLVIGPASGPLGEQRAGVALGSDDLASHSLMWTDLGSSLRLDVAPPSKTTSTFELSGEDKPPVALRVVVVRP